MTGDEESDGELDEELDEDPADEYDSTLLPVGGMSPLVMHFQRRGQPFPGLLDLHPTNLPSFPGDPILLTCHSIPRLWPTIRRASSSLQTR